MIADRATPEREVEAALERAITALDFERRSGWPAAPARCSGATDPPMISPLPRARGVC